MPQPYLTALALPPVTVADVVALRGVQSNLFVDGCLARTFASSFFEWSSTSGLGDDGVNVIRPTDIAIPDPGRWLLIPLSAATPPKEPAIFRLSGVYSGALVPGFFDPPHYIGVTEAARTIVGVEMFRRTAGTAGQTRVDILVNGVTIFDGVPANLPTVTAGAGDNVAGAHISLIVAGAVPAGARIDASLEEVETALVGPPPGPEGLFVKVRFAP